MRITGVTVAGIATTAVLIKKHYIDKQWKEIWEGAFPQVETENSDGTEGLHLKCVQIFFRHGARTPLKHVPNIQEVKTSDNYYPCKIIAAG